MSAVNALAVMARDAGDAHRYRCGEYKAERVIALEGESTEARAAVAELAHKALAAANALEASDDAMNRSKGRMLRAALARVGGEA